MYYKKLRLYRSFFMGIRIPFINHKRPLTYIIIAFYQIKLFLANQCLSYPVYITVVQEL